MLALIGREPTVFAMPALLVEPLDFGAMSITSITLVFERNGSLFAAAAESSGNPIISFLPLVFIFAAMYFFLLRPQRKRQKDVSNLQASIAENDEVVLNSGVYGFVSAIEEEWLWIEIAEKVEIRVSKGSVARKISTPTTQKPAE